MVLSRMIRALMEGSRSTEARMRINSLNLQHNKLLGTLEYLLCIHERDELHNYLEINSHSSYMF